MPQQIAMEGDDVTPEELQGNEWFSVLKRRQESCAMSHAARQSGTQRGATATPNATLRRVAAASRLPAMPRSHNRVIVRPGGGLNVQACSPHRILAALTMAAQLAPSRHRRRKQAQQQTPTPATSPVPAKTTIPQVPPLGPRNPFPTDQPTWADKVACKGSLNSIVCQDLKSVSQCLTRSASASDKAVKIDHKTPVSATPKDKCSLERAKQDKDKVPVTTISKR
ncbi:hypothetical protein MRX96_023588 [Rhipicephalus microplus]